MDIETNIVNRYNINKKYYSNSNRLALFSVIAILSWSGLNIAMNRANNIQLNNLSQRPAVQQYVDARQTLETLGEELKKTDMTYLHNSLPYKPESINDELQTIYGDATRRQNLEAAIDDVKDDIEAMKKDPDVSDFKNFTIYMHEQSGKFIPRSLAGMGAITVGFSYLVYRNSKNRKQELAALEERTA